MSVLFVLPSIREGWLYLAVVLDCFSRKIVGWAMSRNIDADLICNSLGMAIRSRGEASFWDLIHHSDRGASLRQRNWAI